MQETKFVWDHNFNLEPGVNWQIEKSVRPIFDSKIPYVPHQRAPISEFMQNKLKGEQSNFN